MTQFTEAYLFLRIHSYTSTFAIYIIWLKTFSFNLNQIKMMYRLGTLRIRWSSHKKTSLQTECEINQTHTVSIIKPNFQRCLQYDGSGCFSDYIKRFCIYGCVAYMNYVLWYTKIYDNQTNREFAEFVRLLSHNIDFNLIILYRE